MKEGLDLVSLKQCTPVQGARPSRRRVVVLLCVLAWTIFVGVALWWLLRGGGGPAVYLFREPGSAAPHAVETFRAFSKVDLGVQRIYPWVLLGPYVALVALCFPLERGRLRLSLPLNLAACAGFIAASHAISARTTVQGATVIMMRSQSNAVFFEPGPTNPLGIEVAKTSSNAAAAQLEGLATSDILREIKIENSQELAPPEKQSGTIEASRKLATERHGGQPEVIMEKLHDLSDPAVSNLLARVRAGSLPAMPPHGLPKPWSLSILLDLLAYCSVVGLAHSVHFSRRFREREHQALALQSNLANARLNALRAQLQPHFLFNSLNAIAALLRRDARLAEATLLSLSELLRLALSQSQRQEVALHEELNLVQRYLEIQQIRFGERLRVQQDIEPAALDCLVPTLLLQPVVENAIRHGIEPADNAGLVRLSAHRQESSLVMVVEDDGAGLSNSLSEPAKDASVPDNAALVPVTVNSTSAISGVRSGTGIGLANLRARLETLYGTRQKLELSSRTGGGVVVRIEIPWRSEASSERVNEPGQS